MDQLGAGPDDPRRKHFADVKSALRERLMRRNIEREEYLGTLATLQALLAQPVPVEAGSGAMQPLASSYLARLSRHETDAVVTATRDFFRKACEARAGNGQPLDPSIFVRWCYSSDRLCCMDFTLTFAPTGRNPARRARRTKPQPGVGQRQLLHAQPGGHYCTLPRA